MKFLSILHAKVVCRYRRQAREAQIITKGAVEEILDVCSYAEFDGEIHPLTDSLKIKAQKISEEMNRQGMRVLAVSQKSFIEKDCNFAIEDEKEMVLIGYLAFLDPPKPSATEAIEQLYVHGVAVKILSGDNDTVVKAIARQVGIDTGHSLTGIEMEEMDETTLKEAVKRHYVILQTHSIAEDANNLSVAGAR